MSKIIVVIFLFFQISATFAKPENGKEFDNWTVRCEKYNAKQSCFIFQNLVLQGVGRRVLHVAVGYLPGSKSTPVILVSMPLGISLPPGASIQIDDHEPYKFQIERCEEQGCRGGFKLEDHVLAQFELGKTATVIFHDGHRKAINVPVSLLGFSAGLAGLQE